MGKVVIKNQPCLKCPSSDARQIYEDQSSFCFSCGTYFHPNGDIKVMDKEEESPSNKKEIEEILTYESRGFKERGITKQVCQFFEVRVSYNSGGEIDTHYYPYKNGDEIGFKIRRLPKTFRSVGRVTSLFGKSLFAGAGKRLIITEGEIDALTVAQASLDKYKKIYPVVSVPSASSLQALLDNRDWIRSFQEVVIAFDNDKAGEDATHKALRIIGIDKAKLVKFPQGCKDSSDVYTKHSGERLLQVIWDAEPWKPAGIINKEKLWDELKVYNEKPSHPYPSCLSGVNKKTKGMRGGEIALFISGTGSGKSTLFREVMLHVLETTDEKIGVISLEESPPETARKLAGMVLEKNPAEVEIPIEDLKKGFDQVFGEDRVIILDHQGSINDASVVDQLEYMALIGCKKIFIDHITILVSEGADGLSGNEAIDKVMNDLLRLVKRHPEVWIGLISHLRKAQTGGRSFEEGRLPSVDDIKGSGSIKQISFDIIAFARNMTAIDEQERNSIKMAVLKCRHTGLTGPVPGAYYHYNTGRLSPLDTLVGNEGFDPL